jgi:hypothetical protein
MGTPLLDALQSAQNAQSAASLHTAATGNPDQAAKAQRHADVLGLPPETAQRNLGQAEQQFNVRQAAAAAASSPALKAWATDPNNAALAVDHMPLLANVGEKLRDAFSGAAGSTGDIIKGLGSAVDRADYLLMSPQERALVGDSRFGRGPTFSQFVAPAATPLVNAAQATAPKNPTGADRLAQGVGSFAPLFTASILDPLLGAASFGAQGAQSAQEDANAHGATEAQAAPAVLENAGLQTGLGLIPGEAVAGRFLPKLANPALNAIAGLGAAGAANAALGGAMQLGENAIAKGNFDPNRKVIEGVADSAEQMGRWASSCTVRCICLAPSPMRGRKPTPREPQPARRPHSTGPWMRSAKPRSPNATPTGCKPS